MLSKVSILRTQRSRRFECRKLKIKSKTQVDKYGTVFKHLPKTSADGSSWKQRGMILHTELLIKKTNYLIYNISDTP